MGIFGGTCSDAVSYQIGKVSTTSIVTTTKWTELLTYVNQERARRSAGAISSPGFTGSVTAAKLNTLINAIPGTYSGAISSVSAGTIIKAAEFNAVVDKLNAAGSVCLCNCNYCTCNCNYCTCNCNHSCTCNCNYSDRRLKTNIKFLRFEKEIKVYSYNYIYDNKKTYEGVIAQDLIGTCFEQALSLDELGYYMVDYSLLPIELKEINERN